MSWIQVAQTNTIEDGEFPYSMVLEVTDGSGIEKELFVLRVDDDTYQYVATSADLRAYPASKAEAEAQNTLHYRASKVSPRWATQIIAQKFLTQAHARLRSVVKAVGDTRSQPAFGGIEAFIYDSEDA